MNKNGSLMGILYIGMVIFVLLFLGVLLAIGAATLDLLTDTAIPEFTNIGMVGDANLSQISEITLTPIETTVQNLTWLTGVLYLIGLMMIFGLAFVFRSTGEHYLIGLYLVVVIMIVISAIFISNIYEELYNSGDELGVRLQEQVLLSNMIIYSPRIMTIISFIAGILLFSGAAREDGI